MSATVESLGVSVQGQVVRRHDRANDRTTLVLNQGQARELFDALAPVLSFFDQQLPTKDVEIVVDAAK
jgi:hypothetical protein